MLLGAVRNTTGSFLSFTSQVGMSIFGLKEIVGAALGAADALFRPALALEQTNVAFIGLFRGNEAAAKSFLSELRKFDEANTFFDWPTLTMSSRKMMAFGIEAKNIIPYMSRLGDTIATMGGGSAEINRAVYALGQMNARTKVAMGEMNQLTEIGIPAWDLLSEAMGKPVKELMDLSEKGDLVSSVAIPALMQGMERFAGGMERNAGTAAGMIDKVRSNLEKALLSATGPMLESAKGGLKSLGDIVSGPAFQNFATGTGVLIGNVMENTGKIVGGSVVPGFQLLAEKMSPVGQIVQNLASRVRPFIDRVGAWADRNDILEKSLSALESVLNLARNAFNAAEGALGPIIDAVVDWTAKNDPLAIALDVVKNAVNFAKTAIDNAKQAIENIVKWYKDWEPVILSVSGAITVFFLPAIIKAGVEATVSGTKITASFIASVIKTGTEATISGVKLTVSFVAGVVKAGVEAIVSAAKITASFVVSLVRVGVEGWASAVKLVPLIASFVVSGVQAAIAGAIIAGQFVVSLIRTGIQAAITGGILLASLVPGIVAVIAQSAIAAAVAIPGLIVGFVGWAIAAGAAAIATIAATWPILAIVAIIALVVAGIILAVTHWGEIMHWIQEVAKSVWAGIQSAWSGAIGFFKGVGDGIWNGIKWGLNMAIEGINTLIGFLNGLHIGIPAFEIAGVKTPAAEIRLPHIPSIPKLARGGLIGEEGFADVHRDERIYLPRGARVVPASQAQQMREAPAQGPITVILQVDRYQLGKVIMPLVSENVRLSTGVRI